MIPCIVCKKTLEQVFPNGTQNQPSQGTAFQSPGHYGSGAYDPMESDEKIEINVCDDCLIAAGKDGAVLSIKTRKALPIVTLTPWAFNAQFDE